MNLDTWVSGFKTIYEGIWIGISKDVKDFSEDENSYKVELDSGQVYFLNKHDANRIEDLLEDKKIELLFGIEKQQGKCTEILMEFQYDTEKYRVLTSYGLEGKEQINLYAWGEETFPYAIEIAKAVCSILLERKDIRNKHQNGLLTFNYSGIVNKNNCML